jgi:hypothetical protein
MASAFLFKTQESLDRRRITLWHGDVLVWDQQTPAWDIPMTKNLPNCSKQSTWDAI